MRAAQLIYGEASDVADYLMGATKVDVDTLTGALINALQRIDRLEGQASALRREVESLRREAPPAIKPTG
jgi:hypothetical protein